MIPYCHLQKVHLERTFLTLQDRLSCFPCYQTAGTAARLDGCSHQITEITAVRTAVICFCTRCKTETMHLHPREPMLYNEAQVNKVAI